VRTDRQGSLARRALSLALALVALVAAACNRTDRSATELPPGPKRVRCVALTEQTSDDVVELRGAIAPLFGKDAQIAPQVAGRILGVPVHEGDRVRTGQELARIDDATLTDEVHQSQSVVAKAEAETALARTTEARVRRVFERGIVARQELDDAGARLATARAGEAEARSSNDIARRQRGRASVRSPFAGVVLKVFRKPGELVDGTPGTPVVEIGDPSTLELVATVTGAELVQVRAGAIAQVNVPVMPNRSFTGRVSLVSPAVDRTTGLGTVRVRLDSPGPDAPPIGVTGTARIGSGKTRRRSLVPSVAIRAPNGAEAEIVLCGTDGRAHVLLVGIGGEVAGWVEIHPRRPTDGTAPVADGRAVLAGSTVVTDPVLGIEDGDAIEIEKTPR
jgi:RND family efflux transporter MFP subunit